jgi:ketosteroid isomerase-like protein
MSKENAETVRRVFDSWAKGEFRRAALPLDEYVLYVVSRDFPEFGVFVGPDGFEEHTRRFFAQWERLSIEAERVETIGGTVLVKCLQRSKGRASGIEGDFRYFMLFTFRGDKIVRMDALMGEKEALEAAGLSE